MVDLTGKKFGRLIVIKRLDNDKRGYSRWLCLCDCGKETIVSGGNLKSGNTQSCGCLQKEISIKTMTKTMTKHGHSQNNITYRTWRHMKERCDNPSCKEYKYYGGRGIKVCKRWMKYENFLEDMGERPEGLSLDRKNNNKNYCKSNCRWATPEEQARNRRDNHLITAFGKTQCIAVWSEETGIPHGVIYWRITHGWPPEKALTESVRKQEKRRKNGNRDEATDENEQAGAL